MPTAGRSGSVKVSLRHSGRAKREPESITTGFSETAQWLWVPAHPRLKAGVGRDDSEAIPPHSSRHRSAPKDRKSTRLNSSHRCISYAVFCLKKKKIKYKY